MFSASDIDSRTIQAYLETEYHVYGNPHVTLRVGQPSAQLLSAHRHQKTDCSAFLTACNPFSKPFSEASNAARQIALTNELSSRGLVFLPGIGQHPSNQWPGEDSFLIFGLNLDAAKMLGTRFEQNGFIWTGADAIPQLILLK